MLAKGYVSGQIFGQRDSFSKITGPSQLGGNALRQHPINDLNGQSDWRKDPRISCFRDFVRKRIAESCELEAKCHWQEQAHDLVNVLENQLFMDAASMEDYMNQGLLRQRLQNLLQRKMVDVQERFSYTVPTCEVRPTVGLPNGSNSDAACPSFDQFKNDITKRNLMFTDNSDQFSFLKGLLDNDNEPEVAVTNDSHMRQISNEILLSRERTSAVTTFSERSSTLTTSSCKDGFSEIGALDGGPLFSKGDYQYSYEASSQDTFQQQLLTHGLTNNQKLPALGFPSRLTECSEFTNSISQISECVCQMIYEDSVPRMGSGLLKSTLENVLQPKSWILKQELQHPHSSYEQLNKPVEDPASSFFAEQSGYFSPLAEQTIPVYSQFPLEQSYGVASESSTLLSSSKGTAGQANSVNLFQPYVRKKILLAYISHKSSPSPEGDFLVSFVNYLHSIACNNCTCMCEHFCLLLSHFDRCHRDDCNICGLVRDQCDRSHLNFDNMNEGHLSNSSNNHTGGSGSCYSESILPPAKRLKLSSHCLENLLSPSKHLKRENSCNLLLVQPSGLPPLLQWPESPVSINSEVLEGNIEFSKSMQNSLSANQSMNSYGDGFSKLNAESLDTPSEELIVHPKSEGIVSRCFGEPADVKDKPNESRFNAKPTVSEELAAPTKDEVTKIMSNFDIAQPYIETEKEEAIKQENLAIRGVSLIEFFSEDEIKNHISSLQRGIGQKILKGEKEGEVLHCANENTCQLCAADKLLLAPVPIYCSSCGSRIKRSVIYYSTSEESGMRHCFCTLCYKTRGGSITFYGITVPKAKLDKKKNDEEIEEPWVQCDKCKCWQHQICALFNDKRDMEGKSEYLCPKCCLEEIKRGEHMQLPKVSVFGAKDLPSTLLSDYIEQRLCRRLQQEREERAKAIGKNFDEVPGAEDLVVRVVLSINKQLKVKEQFLEIFHDSTYPDEFPYKSKVILLFQKIEGVDVCIFGMYVQEFGSECSQPNHRCVYISYLDSVKYFRPETETAAGEALRTFVYHEILIGYLEYCKKRGFVACYLWACPPLKGEDYILYSHPEIQKTPKSDKLRQWYHSMLKKASKENIVVDFTNLYDHFFIPTGQFYSKVTAARLPYFDGDYWSGVAENIIKNIELKNGEHSGRKAKKVMTKRTLKAMGHTNSSGAVTKDILLMQKLGQSIFPVKEDFIVVHLQFVCTYCHEVILSGWRWCCSQCKNFQLCERCHDVEQGLNGGDTHTVNSKEKHLLSKIMVDDFPLDTKDEDGSLDNWLFENRHTFLGLCQKSHYQFDTLRRAKHSSMMVLHYLHNPTMLAAGTTCSICLQDTNTNDSNVCATCCNTKFGSSRVHKLTYNSSTCENESKYVQQNMLKELLLLLQHANLCRRTNGDPCSYPNCQRIKRLFLHTTTCTLRFYRGCKPCIKVWRILELHASICKKTDCCIPRCRDLNSISKDSWPNTCFAS